MTLRPAPGFNPAQIGWGGPDEPPTVTCSYCDAALPGDEDDDYYVPLILWREDGWCAQFCWHCQVLWFGTDDGRGDNDDADPTDRA